MNFSESTQPSLHLEEVWKQRGISDQLSSFATFLHHSKLAFVFLAKSPLTSVLSIFSVATVLFILGLIMALQHASMSGLNTAAGQLQMSVFVRDNASAADLEALMTYSKNLQGLLSQRRLDKAAALAELRKILSDSPDLLSGLDEDNPLPASLELSFDVAQGESLPLYAKELRKMNGVEAVSYDGQLVKVLSELGAKLKGAGKLSTVVLIGLTLFLIATTIRISLYHEKDEIEIMSLVGAYHNFIQAPFVIGGALQGLAGSLLACIFLSLMQHRLLGVLRSDELLTQASLNFSLLSFQNVFLLTLLGVGAGVAGSYLASRHFR